MSWHLGPMASFDTESTGLDLENDRIVTAAVLLLGGKGPAQTHTWLSDADGVEIPEAAEKIHKISTEHARTNGRPAAEVIALVSALLAEQVAASVPIIAMNARFDFTLLDRECARHGLPSLAEQAGRDPLVIDPYVLDKHLDKYRKGSRQLIDMAAHYKVELPTSAAHDAGADALAAARITYKLAARHPILHNSAIEYVHQCQVIWAREQAASLQAHFRRKGDPNAVVEGAWPLIPRQRVTQ
jgi:DNA polymerase-3 subunit epsilon